MSIYLDGSANTGEAIMQDIKNFTYNFTLTENSVDSTLYQFHWKFDEQEGYASIRLKTDGRIDQSSLIDRNKPSSFKRPLSAYNDPTLFDVFKIMLNSQNIAFK